MRSHHGKHTGHGDDGIGGVATVLQNSHTSLRSQRMASGYRANLASHIGTVLRRIQRS
jgi:hypothetical protein